MQPHVEVGGGRTGADLPDAIVIENPFVARARVREKHTMVVKLRAPD